LIFSQLLKEDDNKKGVYEIMIRDGFMYIAVLAFITGVIACLPRFFSGKKAKVFFDFAPPVVLIYLGLMVLCTVKLWDLGETKAVYTAIKNPLLYAMLFIMLLRCDLRKIIKLGPKMLIGFFAASISIGIGFVVAFSIMGGFLSDNAWKSLGALCGSWMGGGGNMMAIQAALKVDEGDMAYALVMDSICATVYVMFLLWVIGFKDKFNNWTKANTNAIDEVGKTLEGQMLKANKDITWQNISFVIGIGLLASGVAQMLGQMLGTRFTIFDASTWTVLVVTVLGVGLAITPIGEIRGTEEISNTLLYIVIALIASRADLLSAQNAHLWIITGLIILFIHVLIMIIVAKILKMDIFTCAVASLANIGGTATAPVLAGTYNSALVPVGVIMALLGYVVGTGGGLIVAEIMSFFA